MKINEIFNFFLNANKTKLTILRHDSVICKKS